MKTFNIYHLNLKLDYNFKSFDIGNVPSLYTKLNH